jgi:hypothetical protein
MHLALERIHAVDGNGGVGRDGRQHLTADDEVPGLAGDIRTDHPRHRAQRVARDHRIAPVAVQIEVDREQSLGGCGTQRVEHLGPRPALPDDVTQHRLVDRAERLIEERAGLLPLEQIDKGNRDETTVEQRLLGAVVKAKLHPPDLRHHLLLRIEVNQLAEYPVIGVLQRHADDRVLRRRRDLLAAELGAGDPASDKTENRGAFRVPAAVVTRDRKVLVFFLERGVVEVADVIVDGRDVGLKTSGEDDARHIKIAHRRTPSCSCRRFTASHHDASPRGNTCSLACVSSQHNLI